ncbi:MAG: YHS domain protein, partial [Pseudomonadota bacterium]
MKYSVKTLIGIALICLFSTSANAIKPIYSGGKERAALRGYDVVAYFTENAPVKGSAEFTTEHKGAKWLFANEANLALFV